jgi:hypothetical protein
VTRIFEVVEDSSDSQMGKYDRAEYHVEYSVGTTIYTVVFNDDGVKVTSHDARDRG